MSNYDVSSISDLLRNNSYPGRGIIAGRSADGTKACAAYFIMGRSANSRNRVFAMEDGVLYTRPFDLAKVQDPSLIIYAAVRESGNRLVVTNGNQTDTICEGFAAGKTFSGSLSEREFEPDRPNYTPRISAVLAFGEKDFTYSMNILKSVDALGSACARYTFDYPSVPGLGHFLHTYVSDGDPIPSFLGEPERVGIPDDIDVCTAEIWDSLNEANKISLWVRYTDLSSGSVEERIVNKNR